MESRTISVLGLRTRVLVERAEAAADPIVLIHGVGGWAENFRAVMAPLAATGRSVFAIDLPGFGETERPGRVRYFGPEDAFYPRFVLAAMDALGVPRAHIVGNSMGGAIAYMVAVTAPERTGALVLVAAGGLGTEVALFLRVAALPGFGLLALLPRSAESSRRVLRTCFYDPARITPELYEEVVRYGDRSFPEFVRAMHQALSPRGVRRGVRAAWVGRAARYAGPVLVVWGREDRVLPLSDAAGLGAIFPRGQLSVIERCGHMPMAECPEAFLDAVVPFLERAERAAAA